MHITNNNNLKIPFTCLFYHRNFKLIYHESNWDFTFFGIKFFAFKNGCSKICKQVISMIMNTEDSTLNGKFTHK